MGRNARRRKELREEQHAHGVVEETEQGLERPSRCPRCGSTNLVIGSYMAGVTRGVDIICGNCNWQGMLRPGIW